MRLRSVWTWVVPAMVSPLLSACGGSGDTPDIGQQDPLWESVIERHSRGEISRRERIRIVFAHDVVDDSRVGESAAEVVSIEPAIAGSVTFASRREIVVSPEGDLEPGAAFVVLRPLPWRARAPDQCESPRNENATGGCFQPSHHQKSIFTVDTSVTCARICLLESTLTTLMISPR